MEATAKSRYIGTSPRKMRLVIDLIRGLNVEQALGILEYQKKHAARSAAKVLRSAIANLQNKETTGRLDMDEVFVQEAFVDGGPSMKRVLPAPMGRAYRMRKRSHHLTITVAKKEARVKKAAPQSKKPVTTAS